MILKIQSVINKNVKTDDYYSVTGENTFMLFDDANKIIDVYTHPNVLWTGKGSPYPTPDGGIWDATRTWTKKLGDCFYVATPFETDIFIHLAQSVSYGCFIIEPNEIGISFLKVLLHHPKISVIHFPIDDFRSAEEKRINPINYTDIKRRKIQ